MRGLILTAFFLDATRMFPVYMLHTQKIVTNSPYSEGTNERALASSATASSAMNVTVCVNFCKSGGFPYAGVEYSTEVCLKYLSFYAREYS